MSTATIETMTADWPFPQMTDMLHKRLGVPADEYFSHHPALVESGNWAWLEVTEALWWEFLEVLPPIYLPDRDAFQICEAQCDSPRGPIRSTWVKVAGRYFGIEIAKADYPEARKALLNALAQEQLA